MIDNIAEIDVQVGGYGVRVRGTENFVESKFKELAEIYLSRSSGTSVACEKRMKNSSASTMSEHNFGDLYSIDPDSGKLSIHGTVPGGSKSERMRNVALVTLFCLASDEPVSGTIIKEVCRDQACLDQPNFAAAIKKDKKNFVVSGKNAEWLAKLTVFGKEKAEELLVEMLNG